MGHLTVMQRPDASEAIKEYCRAVNCRYTQKIFEAVLWRMAADTAATVDGADPFEKIDHGTRMSYC